MDTLLCTFGSAEAAIPISSCSQVAEIDVSGPLPVSKRFVMGVSYWSEKPVIVCGFRKVVQGSQRRQVVLLRTHQRGSDQVQLAVEVTRVKGFGELGSVVASPSPEAPLALFMLAKDSVGRQVRVLDVERLLQHLGLTDSRS